MSPIKEYTNWNIRKSDIEKKVPIHKRYYFICEGRNTEKWYFKKLIDRRKELSISDNIELVFLEKTGTDENVSNPKSLLKLAKKQKASNKYNPQIEQIIIIFDADIYKDNKEEYQKLIKNAKGFKLGVTYPSFELFLLLHNENAVDKLIKPHKKEIIENEWVNGGSVSRKRYVHKLFTDNYKINPKTNDRVGDLVNYLDIAIAQENKINSNIDNAVGVITSNIGHIIKSIIKDKGN